VKAFKAIFSFWHEAMHPVLSVVIKLLHGPRECLCFSPVKPFLLLANVVLGELSSFSVIISGPCCCGGLTLVWSFGMTSFHISFCLSVDPDANWFVVWFSNDKLHCSTNSLLPEVRITVMSIELILNLMGQLRLVTGIVEVWVPFWYQESVCWCYCI